MKVRTNTKADGRRINHNQVLAVAAFGVITLLIGSIISCIYDDIKKVLAIRWLLGHDRSSGQLYERGVRTGVKSGGMETQHNEALAVCTGVKAGGTSNQHTEALVVCTGVRGGFSSATNEALARAR